MCYEALGAKPALHNKGFPKMRFVLPTVLCLLAVPVMAQQSTEKQQLDDLQSQAITSVTKFRVTVEDRDAVIGSLSQQNAGLKDTLASMTKDRDSVKASNDTLTKQVADLQAKLDGTAKK